MLFCLPALIFASIPSRGAESPAQSSYEQSFYPDTNEGLLQKANKLSSWLQEQPETVVATNGWHELVNEQIAYVLQRQPNPGLNQPSDTDEIQNRAKKLDDLARLISHVQQRVGYPELAEFSVPALIAGTEAEFSQTYQLKDALPQAALIILGSSETQSFSLQTVDDNLPNKVSVSSAAPVDMKLEAYSSTRRSGASKVFPAIRIASGEVNSGNSFTINYRNFRVPRKAQPNFVLPISIAFPGIHMPYIVPSEGVRIIAGKAVAMRAVAPSIVKPGQSFNIKVELVDRFGNPASGSTPSLDLLVDGVFRQRVGRSDDAKQIVSVQLNQPGIRNLELRSGGGGLRAAVNPISVSDESLYKLQWTDLHQVPKSLEFGFATKDDKKIQESEISGFEVERSIEEGGNIVVLTKDINQFATLENQILAVGPSSSALALSPKSYLQMAVPGSPTDVRAFNTATGKLVEIVSGSSTYEGFGVRQAIQGNRIGFTATAGTKSSEWLEGGQLSRRGATAVWLKAQETLFDALLESRTYVTSGARILLEVDVNGAMPGARVEQQSIRTISGRVSGTSGIVAIELLKNGVVVDRVSYGSPKAKEFPDEVEGASGIEDLEEAAFAKVVEERKQLLRVSFYSSTAPYLNQTDYPRNGREWIGYLKLTGSTIKNVQAPGFTSETRQGVALHPREADRVDFITWTKGQESSFLIEADFSDDNAVFQLNLKGGQEDQFTEPLLRNPATFPGARQLLNLSELRDGPMDRTIEVNGYRDRVRFELIYEDLPTNQVFSFRDGNLSAESGGQMLENSSANSKSGDFYSVRAIQADDHFAISSPVWVGGFDIYR